MILYIDLKLFSKYVLIYFNAIDKNMINNYNLLSFCSDLKESV